MNDSLPTAYRECVGMMVLNREGRVLVGQRLDSTAEAWQMPQGGIDAGEDVREAAKRELREEIGMDQVTILAETPNWLTYDLPEALIPKLWNGQFRGQKQRWFLMQLEGDESLVNIHTSDPEFRAIAWVEAKELPSLIVPFKKALYEQLLIEFSAPLEAYGARLR